jgi:hypothetical protein
VPVESPLLSGLRYGGSVSDNRWDLLTPIEQLTVLLNAQISDSEDFLAFLSRNTAKSGCKSLTGVKDTGSRWSLI